FPAVARFMADAVTQAEEHGYESTLFGRRRQIPEIRARNWQTRKLGERLAGKSVTQGTAAQILQGRRVGAHEARARAGPRGPSAPPEPGRAGVGGADRGEGGGPGDRTARDGRRRRPRPAADGG